MPAVRDTEARIRRALSAWISAGLKPGAVEVMPDGTVRVLAESRQDAQAAPVEGANTCDGKFGRAL